MSPIEELKMEIHSNVFRVEPSTIVDLGKLPTIVESYCKSKKQYKKLLEEHVEQLSLLQRLHYAAKRYALLLIFLHMSRDEQRKRFIERIDDPDKNWKFSLTDIHERHFWNDYMKAYEDCLGATSAQHAPWYVVPADDKENARVIVSQIVLDGLGRLEVAYPKVSKERVKQLKSIREDLSK